MTRGGKSAPTCPLSRYCTSGVPALLVGASLVLVSVRTFAAEGDSAGIELRLDGPSMRLDRGRFREVSELLAQGRPSVGPPAGDSTKQPLPASLAAPEEEGLWPLRADDRLASLDEPEPALTEVRAVRWNWPVQGVVGLQPTSSSGFLGLGWRIPPFSWGGSIATSASMARTTLSTGKSQETSFSETAAFTGRSYFVSPSVAPVNGSLTLTRQRLATEQSDVTQTNEIRSRSTDLAATFAVTHLPFSASPTDGSYSYATRNTSDGEQFSSHQFRATKEYKELGHDGFLPFGQYRSDAAKTLNYSNGTLTSGFETLNVAANGWRYRDIGLSSYGYMSRATQADGSHTLSYGASLSGSNRYDVEWTDMALNNSGYVSAYGNGQGSSSFVSGLGSSYNWYPFEDIDLPIAGSVNGYYSVLATPETTNRLASIGWNGTTSYRVYNAVSITGAANVLLTWVDGKHEFTGTYTLGLGYGSGYGTGLAGTYTWSDPDVFGFAYNANASYGTRLDVRFGLGQSAGSSGFSTSGVGNGRLVDSAVVVFGNAGQSLSRAFHLGANQSVSASITESVTSSSATLTDPTLATLVHQAIVAYNYKPSARATLDANATYMDSRSYGGADSKSASMSARGMFETPLSRTSRVNGTVMYSASLLTSSCGGVNGTANTCASNSTNTTNNSDYRFGISAWSLVGALNYFNTRLFGIPRADYSASYGVTVTPESTEPGSKVFVAQTLSHRVGYAIGKVTLGLTNSFTVVSGTKNVTIFGTLTRALGG